jgi:MarR family transcriptional regulator, negative regulator of the multidrug operon emrRAB
MPLSQIEQVETNLRGVARRMPELPLQEALTLRVAVILGRDINALLERLLKPAGLAEAEFRLLLALYSHDGEGCAGEMCAALAQSPANLTRLCDALVQRGLVARRLNTTDRRKMQLTLEPAGERLLRSLLPDISATVAAAFDGFSVAERKRLLSGMKRMMAGIDATAAREASSRDEVA